MPDPTKPWYSFQAVADGAPRRAKVMIYDAIGGWFGIQTSEFVKELNDLDVDEIELHLNSPGGSAFDGVAIHNALRQHQAKVTVVVDGLAASAASLVAMGGDEIVMARGSQMMIHDASAIVWGNAAVQRKTADVLDKLSDSYAKVYAARAGGADRDWRTAMLAETWYDADEAVQAGLADRTDAEAEADAKAVASFDLSLYAHAGRAAAPTPLMPAASLPPMAAATREQQRTQADAEVAVYDRLFNGGSPDPKSLPTAVEQAAYDRLFGTGPANPNAGMTAQEVTEYARLFKGGAPVETLSRAEKGQYTRLFREVI